MALTSSQGLAFVVATGDFGRPKPSDRKLIRSHCMRGKNKKTRLLRVAGASTSLGHERPQYASPLSTLASETLLDTLDHFDSWSDIELSVAEVRNMTQLNLSIPPPPPPALSLIKLASTVDEHSKELLYKRMTLSEPFPQREAESLMMYQDFTTARDIFYPFGLCLKHDPSWNTWLGWLSEDPAYLHSVLMGTSALQDYILRKPASKTTYFHARKTIALLNEHLSNSVFSLRDSTVAIILGLALSAEVEQDIAAAQAHAMGLRKIIRLRGGLDSFLQNAKLHVKLRR
jgi:hypothetical protein